MNIKDYREKELKAFIIGNILVLMIASRIVDLNSVIGVSDGMNVITEVSKNLFSGGVIASIFYSFFIVVDALVPSVMKTKLSNLFRVQPGEKIFETIKDKDNCDNRFTKDEALKKYADVYESLALEKSKDKRKNMSNAAWYKIYVKYETNKKIEILNRDYLLCRDMNIATLWTIIFYFLMIVLRIFILDWRILLLLFVEVIATLISTHNKQWRFAYTVIATDISNTASESRR